MEIKDYRKKIDESDRIIVEALKERFAAAEKIGEIKKKEGLEVFCPKREQELLEKIEAMSGEYKEYIAAIYREILKNSKNLQQR